MKPDRVPGCRDGERGRDGESYVASARQVAWIWVVRRMTRLLWAAAVFGVTAYAVFWRGYSGWWFLLALLIYGEAS